MPFFFFFWTVGEKIPSAFIFVDVMGKPQGLYNRAVFGEDKFYIHFCFQSVVYILYCKEIVSD